MHFQSGYEELPSTGSSSCPVSGTFADPTWSQPCWRTTQTWKPGGGRGHGIGTVSTHNTKYKSLNGTSGQPGHRFVHYHCALGNPLRFELGGAVLLEAVEIRPVWGHDAVQAATPRLETLLFGFIVAFDQTHELTHAVTWSDRQRGLLHSAAVDAVCCTTVPLDGLMGPRLMQTKGESWALKGVIQQVDCFHPLSWHRLGKWTSWHLGWVVLHHDLLKLLQIQPHLEQNGSQKSLHELV